MTKRARKRTERRTASRAAAKLVRNLDRLATLGPGGSPERPIPIEAPAQVEVAIAAMPCPLCEGSLRVDEHAAETIDGQRVRIARVTCTLCGTRRAIYFQLRATMLS